mgnify:CR=1 FL=1
MSAIWGYLSYTNTISDDLPALMEAPYKEKCKIDCYRNEKNANLYMGSGIQYITKEAQQEVLPVFEAEKGIFFNADCILDNRNELISLLNADAAEPDGTLMYLAYKKWGIDCLKHFRGLFSMAVYEANTDTLYLVADQVSSRCLYYYKTNDFVCFSTLLEPIRRVCPNISFNEYYLKDFLTAPGLMPNIVPTETPYEGIYKINPGCYMTITRNSVTEHRYWSPFMQKKHRHLTAKAYGKEFRALYTECVKDALRTDSGVGISLSSGLDSASVGALAATTLRENGKTLYSYTYVPYETPEPDKRNKDHVHDETKDVMKIVDMHPNINPHFLNNNGKNCLEFVRQGIDIMEIPFKAIVNLPNLYEVYYHARKDGCRIVLTGQMGNATVSHGYINDILFDDYKKGHFLRFLYTLNRHAKITRTSRKKALHSCLNYYNYAKKIYRSKEIELIPDNPFLAENILENYPYKERYHVGEISFLEQLPLDKAAYHVFLYKKAILTYLGELDTKMGLATGIVIRDATRDARILQFCADLPHYLFAYKGIPRWLIRGNFTDLLPPVLLEDWIRYGVQNSDWLLRIKRDWSVLHPNLEALFAELISSNDVNQLLHIKKLQQYLRSHSAEDLNAGNNDFSYLIYAKILLALTKETA